MSFEGDFNAGGAGLAVAGGTPADLLIVVLAVTVATVGAVSVVVAAVGSLGVHPAPVVWLTAALVGAVAVAEASRSGGVALLAVGAVFTVAVMVVAFTHPQLVPVDPPLPTGVVVPVGR